MSTTTRKGYFVLNFYIKYKSPFLFLAVQNFCHPLYFEYLSDYYYQNHPIQLDRISYIFDHDSLLYVWPSILKCTILSLDDTHEDEIKLKSALAHRIFSYDHSDLGWLVQSQPPTGYEHGVLRRIEKRWRDQALRLRKGRYRVRFWDTHRLCFIHKDQWPEV